MGGFNTHGCFRRFAAKVLLLIACYVCLSNTVSYADPSRLDYLGTLPKKSSNGHVSDTSRAFDIFNKFLWNIQITRKDGQVVNFVTTKPDSIRYGEIEKVSLTTTFTVAPALLDVQNGLFYELNGSVLMSLNGEPILATGTFAKDDGSSVCNLRQKNYTSFVFKDSVANISITYLPHPRSRNFVLNIKMVQWQHAKEKIAADIKDKNESFALGFYYLAFALVFLILFIFSRERTENLYFSLFCLFGSLSWIEDIYETASITLTTTFLAVFSLEFLAIFLAKVIKNKKRTKIPLIFLTICAAISFHPAIMYNTSFLGSYFINNLDDISAPIAMMVIFASMFCYSTVSSIVYLVKGFGQKSWEAKTIVIICCCGLFISMLLPSLLKLIPAIRHSFVDYSIFSDFLGDIGLCIYPLSAAIVLGRRNALNQKQLSAQIKSIERLSEENLNKEKEKKQILEEQNAQLEQKVAERTSEVLQQKKLVEIKNNAITDNLTYAQRIQSALLPDIQLINRALRSCFILYLPKDIVSGDFYSFTEKNGRAIIIAGDCTGHGVSGAFMSMIGSSLLTEIINGKGIDMPAEILNNLNEAVIETLKQTQNESNDGMDISICSFDKQDKQLQYAGANRPIYLVRNNALEILKPDKLPIGGLQIASDRVFSNHTVQLQENDTIYLFTDGYADQFGGPLNKKMMVARFKEVLLSIQHLNMDDQHAYLKTYFDQWKGANDQVDDVLVIGIRV